MPKYEYTCPFLNNLSFKYKGSLGDCNTSRKIQLKPEISHIRNFKEKMAAVKIESQPSFI